MMSCRVTSGWDFLYSCSFSAAEARRSWRRGAVDVDAWPGESMELEMRGVPGVRRRSCERIAQVRYSVVLTPEQSDYTRKFRGVPGFSFFILSFKSWSAS